jgi:hypothetical protein
MQEDLRKIKFMSNSHSIETTSEEEILSFITTNKKKQLGPEKD